MVARTLDGRAAQAEIKAELVTRVAELRRRGIVPGLGTILVGDDPASQSYVRMKHRDCEQVGIASVRIELPAGTSQDQLQKAIARLNADSACTRLPDPAAVTPPPERF